MSSALGYPSTRTASPQLIPLEELRRGNNNKNNGVIDLLVSSGEEEDVEFSKEVGGRGEGVPQVAPLTVHVTMTDLVFNAVTLVVIVVTVGIDFALVPYHYYAGGNAWAAWVTAGVVGVGGFALLKQFWGVVTYDQLDRIYGYGKCVRLCVNGFPWLAPIITCWTGLYTGYESKRNPMALSRYANLLSLTKRFMIVLGIAQCAPQALVQLVVLLEEGGGDGRGPLLVTSVTASLTVMMISNLPVKSEDAGETLKPVAYSGYSRVFVGIRMLSSFASRTIALSCVFCTFRCLVSSSPFIAHCIPVVVLLLPRLVFALTEYTRYWISRKKPTSPVTHLRFFDVLVAYIATVFIPVSEPTYMFWYVSIETIVFVTYGVIAEVVTGGVCFTLSFGSLLLTLFLVSFAVVPCVVPVVVDTHARRSARSSYNTSSSP